METIKWMQAKTSHAIAGTGNRSPLSNLSAHTKSSKHCNPERKLHRLVSCGSRMQAPLQRFPHQGWHTVQGCARACIPEALNSAQTEVPSQHCSAARPKAAQQQHEEEQNLVHSQLQPTATSEPIFCRMDISDPGR
eukprot:1145989-Pelagomonas_calceolata.AAC.2